MRISGLQGRVGAVAGVGLLLAPCACVVATATVQAATGAGACTKVAFEFKVAGQLAAEAVLTGATKLAAAYGFCSPSYGAPRTSEDVMEQIAALKADVKDGDKVIVLSADDPVLPGPILRAAMKAGVKVVTFGSGGDVPGARDVFVQDTAYDTLARAVINAIVKALGPPPQLGVMTMTPDALAQVSWLSALRSDAVARHIILETMEWLPFQRPVTMGEDMLHAYPGMRALLGLDENAIAGAAQAVTDLGKVGKVAVFGIGDPAPLRSYFAGGSLRALFGWDETDEGELLMCVAKLAYDDKAQPATTFTCPRGPGGSWTVAARPDQATGASQGTVIFSQPLEFTAENYKSYDF